MLSDKQQYNIIRRVATKTRKQVSDNRSALFIGVAKHLGGLCGNASALMFDNLQKAGLQPEIVQGWGHWYNRCGPWLVDITASQFGQGKICIRNFSRTQELIKSQDRAMAWWDPQKISNNLKDSGLESTLKTTKEKLGIK